MIFFFQYYNRHLGIEVLLLFLKDYFFRIISEPKITVFEETEVYISAKKNKLTLGGMSLKGGRRKCSGAGDFVSVSSIKFSIWESLDYWDNVASCKRIFSPSLAQQSCNSSLSLFKTLAILKLKNRNRAALMNAQRTQQGLKVFPLVYRPK